MAKAQLDLIYDDGTLAYVRLRCTRISVCAGQPSSYTDANSTTGNMRARSTTVLTSTNFTLADGDTSGRKITVDAQNGMTVIADGTADHVAWIGSSGSTLLLVTTCTTQGLTSGNTINVPAHDFEIRDVA